MIPARLLCALAALIAPELAFAQGERLQNDPFARPNLVRLQSAARGAPQSAVARPPAAEPKRALNLQAVMLAGPNSIANVDGTMLRIGEQIYGYRLVAVHERAAVFEKDKTQFTVAMRGQSKAPQAATPEAPKSGEPQ